MAMQNIVNPASFYGGANLAGMIGQQNQQNIQSAGNMATAMRDDKQNRIKNALTAAAPVIEAGLKAGDTDFVNKYTNMLLEQNPDLQGVIAKIPGGVKVPVGTQEWQMIQKDIDGKKVYSWASKPNAKGEVQTKDIATGFVETPSMSLGRDVRTGKTIADLTQTPTAVGTSPELPPASQKQIPAETVARESAQAQVKNEQSFKDVQTQMQNISDVFNTVKAALDDIPPGYSGAVSAKASQIVERLGLGNEDTKKIASAQAKYNAAKARMSEIVRQFGERGVLTDKDIDRTFQLLAQVPESKAERATKFETVEGFLNGRIVYNAQKAGIPLSEIALIDLTGDIVNAAGQPTSKMSEEDKQALAWAEQNPNDSRAKEIKRRLGVQ